MVNSSGVHRYENTKYNDAGSDEITLSLSYAHGEVTANPVTSQELTDGH